MGCSCGVCFKSYFMPSNALLKAYNSIVFPHFTYCCTVWSDVKNQFYLEKVFKLQKRAARILLNILPAFCFPLWTGCRSEIITCTERLSFYIRFYTPKCQILYRCFVLLEMSLVGKTGQTRARTEHFERSFSYSCAFLWNKLSQNVRNSSLIDVLNWCISWNISVHIIFKVLVVHLFVFMKWSLSF
jgi:hypothetical protein